MREPMRGSVTRIAELPGWPFACTPAERDAWASGDLVLAEVVEHPYSHVAFELASGRVVRPMTGDLLVGALARRYATLEATGSFEDVREDGRMHCLTSGGCMGRATSISRFASPMIPLRYRGHLVPSGKTVRLADFVPEPPDVEFDMPVVLVAGTSMSAGKTFSGRVVVRELDRLGHTVAAAKLTGAGRWHDTLSMADAGAAFAFDFVDAGLPTSVVPEDEFRDAISGLLRRIAATGASVLVVEAGASPLEPYNGGTLVDMLDQHVAFTVIAASDPYAVVGIREAWGRTFDLVAGPAANTTAGVDLVHRLADLPALDLLDDATHGSLRQRLAQAVGSRGER